MEDLVLDLDYEFSDSPIESPNQSDESQELTYVDVGNQRMGKVDGKLIAFGADSFVNLQGHPLVENGRFVDLLTLFASSVGYHRAMRRSLKRRVKAAKAGESYCHLIEDEELRLRHNGRAAA